MGIFLLGVIVMLFWWFGIHDSVIVFTDDAALIAAKSESQRIKEIVAKISADPEFKNLI